MMGKTDVRYEENSEAHQHHVEGKHHDGCPYCLQPKWALPHRHPFMLHLLAPVITRDVKPERNRSKRKCENYPSRFHHRHHLGHSFDCVEQNPDCRGRRYGRVRNLITAHEKDRRTRPRAISRRRHGPAVIAFRRHHNYVAGETATNVRAPFINSRGYGCRIATGDALARCIARGIYVNSFRLKRSGCG